MESKRQSKISKVLQKDLAEIFQQRARNLTGKALITVTKVNVTPDLSLAKVYLSVFGTDQKDEIVENIRKGTKEFRYQLGIRVKNQMRAVPELQFYLDDSLDYIENIENLLKDD